MLLKLQTPTSEITFEHHGSIVLARPSNEEARVWLTEHVQSETWQWFGGALAVEPRSASYLMDILIEAGFEVKR